MSQRPLTSFAVLFSAALILGCGPLRPNPDGGTGGSGGGAAGGGAGGGAAGGGAGGGTSDGGVMPETVMAAKASTYPVHVNLKNVVVTAVGYAKASGATTNCAGTSTKGVNANFWVADQNAPQSGIYVYKYRCDPDPDYLPVVGDVLDIEGYVGFQSSFEHQEAFRVMLKSQYEFLPSPRPATCALPGCVPLTITKKSAGSPLPDNTVSAGFGNAQGGTVKADSTYLGSRVSIPGSLSITTGEPMAFKRLSALSSDTVFYGYEVTGGILVSDYYTRSLRSADGGYACPDFRRVKVDGGSITFANGLKGVWDTYSHAACADGGTDVYNCYNNRGIVPGTPDANYTNVLYPMDCANDAVGTIN